MATIVTLESEIKLLCTILKILDPHRPVFGCRLCSTSVHDLQYHHNHRWWR
jgi:hypothetical protein